MKILFCLILLGIAQTKKKRGNVLPNRPNIIMIIADDMGYQDAGFKGSDILTPNIDSLAKEGVVLETHYVMPQCSPTRASLLSGRHAVRNSFWKGNIKPTEAWGLKLNETTMPEMLKRNGYATHGIGKWHNGFHTWKHTPAQRGFDTFLGLYNGAQDYFKHKRGRGFDLRLDYHDENGEFVDKLRYDLNNIYDTDIFSDRAVSVISDHDRAKPLFMYLAYTAPHDPFQVPAKEREKYSAHMPKSSKIRKTYASMISVMDRGIGDVVAALDQHGLKDNTLIVFFSDNGSVMQYPGSNYPLRGGKHGLHEGGVRALAFVNSPLLRETGYTNRDLFHVTDWYPTFQALARDKPSEADKMQLELDGMNVWKSIAWNERLGREDVLLNMRIPEKIYRENATPALSKGRDDIVEATMYDFFVIRSKKWKLYAGEYLMQGWDSPNNTKGKSNPNGKLGRGVKLYDLDSDPAEEHDVSSTCQDIVQDILAKKAAYAEKMTWIGQRNKSKFGMNVKVWKPWVEL